MSHINTEIDSDFDDEPILDQLARMGSPDIKSENETGVKIEMLDELSTSVSTGNISTRRQRTFKCPLCSKKSTSRYEIILHLTKKHIPKCKGCHVKFKSWNKYENHIPFCTRANGLVKIEPRSQIKKRKPNLPFQCQLCKR